MAVIETINPSFPGNVIFINSPLHENICSVNGLGYTIIELSLDGSYKGIEFIIINSSFVSDSNVRNK